MPKVTEKEYKEPISSKILTEKSKENSHVITPNTLTSKNDNKREVSGLSLKSIQFRLAAEKAKRELKKIDINNLPKNHFTQNELESIWKVYVDKKEANGQKIEASNLRSSNPKITDDQTIKLKVDTETTKREIEEQQYELLEFLRNSLNNYHITLDIDVSKSTTKIKAFTSEDKYKRLNEINPLLEYLRKELNLDL